MFFIIMVIVMNVFLLLGDVALFIFLIMAFKPKKPLAPPPRYYEEPVHSWQDQARRDSSSIPRP